MIHLCRAAASILWAGRKPLSLCDNIVLQLLFLLLTMTQQESVRSFAQSPEHSYRSCNLTPKSARFIAHVIYSLAEVPLLPVPYRYLNCTRTCWQSCHLGIDQGISDM